MSTFTHSPHEDERTALFKTRVISDLGLSQTADGLTIDVRLPWYRALPLSTVSIPEVKIDGETIVPEDISFRINGKSFSLSELPEQVREWWYVLDSGLIDVRGKKVPSGSEHEISVTIGCRPPYIPGFFRMTECTKRLIAQPGDGVTQ